jgi:hypothetical protein
MTLKARKPETIEKRPKLFVFGEAGSTKTRTALQFPNNYHFDCERGADNYADLYKASNSVRMQTTDYDEIIDQLKALATEKHNFQTVTIDPITTVESDLIMRSEDSIAASLQQRGSSAADAQAAARGDMRVWRDRDRCLKRLGNLLLNLDMNVIVIAHSKIEYGDQMKKLGTTYDGWKRWVYLFDLALEVQRRGANTVAVVRKSRLEKFPDGEVFDFSYNAIRDRFGASVEREVKPVVLATAEQVVELKQLLEIVKMPDDTVDKWLAKAGVDALGDMTAETIGKCIAFVQAKLPKEKTVEV